MRCLLRAGAKMEDGKKLRGGVDGQPQPEHLRGAAQPGSQFVQLDVWEVQMEEETLVQDLRVHGLPE
jgi:hypothetical protein